MDSWSQGALGGWWPGIWVAAAGCGVQAGQSGAGLVPAQGAGKELVRREAREAGLPWMWSGLGEVATTDAVPDVMLRWFSGGCIRLVFLDDAADRAGTLERMG